MNRRVSQENFLRVELEIHNRVATLTLCRPEVLNAIDQTMLHEFEEALGLVRQAPEVVLLLTHGSGRAFSAGSDLKELATCSPQQAAEFEAEHGRVFAQLQTLPQITVAVWRGYVLGGGLFLGLYHDFRLAARQATIGLPEVTHGWVPPWGVSRLVEVVGWQVAKRLMLCETQLDGEEARRIGLADGVWSEEEFDEQVGRWVEHLTDRPVTALQETKSLLREMRMLDHEYWDRRAVDAFQRCYETEAAQRAVQRFVEKRKNHGHRR
ncbi:MAG: enoyl-CoA hydratase/isomerase family protein [Candidatus Latescibacteria bacterium]|nr:enoyl-CoA hydratase/isomerase family protein [Candidatus Latescibacterota bacterium]